MTDGVSGSNCSDLPSQDAQKHSHRAKDCSKTFLVSTVHYGFPWWLSSKEFACQCRRCKRCSLIPGSGNGNPLQYSCLENPVHRGVWWAADHGVEKSNMTEWLSMRDAPGTVRYGGAEMSASTWAGLTVEWAHLIKQNSFTHSNHLSWESTRSQVSVSVPILTAFP